MLTIIIALVAPPVLAVAALKMRTARTDAKPFDPNWEHDDGWLD
jgi:hypothetical protein